MSTTITPYHLNLMPPDNHDKKESKVTMSNLEKFLASYGNFINENATVNLDIDSVLRDIATNILEPDTDDPEINRLYERGKSLNREMGEDMVKRLRGLKEEKMYEMIGYV